MRTLRPNLDLAKITLCPNLDLVASPNILELPYFEQGVDFTTGSSHGPAELERPLMQVTDIKAKMKIT